MQVKLKVYIWTSGLLLKRFQVFSQMVSFFHRNLEIIKVWGQKLYAAVVYFVFLKLTFRVVKFNNFL